MTRISYNGRDGRTGRVKPRSEIVLTGQSAHAATNGQFLRTGVVVLGVLFAANAKNIATFVGDTAIQLQDKYTQMVVTDRIEKAFSVSAQGPVKGIAALRAALRTGASDTALDSGAKPAKPVRVLVGNAFDTANQPKAKSLIGFDYIDPVKGGGKAPAWHQHIGSPFQHNRNF